MTPHADLIARLRSTSATRSWAEADQLMEAAANRIEQLDIECATLRHGIRLYTRKIDELEAPGERKLGGYQTTPGPYGPALDYIRGFYSAQNMSPEVEKLVVGLRKANNA